MVYFHGNLTFWKDFIRSLIKLSDDVILSGSYDKSIKIWDYKRNLVLRTIQNPTITGSKIMHFNYFFI